MKNILNTFWQIIYKEILIFAKIYVSKSIDSLIMISTNVIVFTFLMPYFGLESNFGPMVLVGLIPLITFFDMITRASTMVMDITGNKKISYLLTLPLPTSLAIAAIPIGWALANCIITILVLPLGKLVMLSKFSLANLSVYKFLIAFFASNIMFGFFALWLTSLINEMKYISWIWARIVNPLFMLGGYFYTWMAMYSISHIAGIINLINPLLYSIESLRAAVLGQKGYIPYWLSILAILIFISFFALNGISRLKKRLDCV